MGELLGCSRQNVKKLAEVLDKKGFISIVKSTNDARALSAKVTQKTNDYWKEEFYKYQQELKYLFEEYSEDEIALLFKFFMKLYSGIDNLEEKISDDKI